MRNPNKRFANDLYGRFSKEDTQMAGNAHENMVIVIGHHGNANETHSEVSRHILWDGYQSNKWKYSQREVTRT